MLSLFLVTGVSYAATLDSTQNLAINDTLPNGEMIDQLFLKYETQKDKEKQQFFLTASAEQHSGLANLLLAKEVNVPAHKKISYYLQAAKYGYPEKGYSEIAAIYKDGLGVEKDDFLANCYLNLAKYNSSKALVEVCRSRYPETFIVEPNMPLQSAKEVNNKASLDYARFCNNFATHNILNPLLDKNEQKILAQMLCNPKDKMDVKLQAGDIVIKDDNLYQYTSKGYVLYNQKAQDGLPVYRLNPPMSLYIYKKGTLEITKEGDQVIKDDKTYIVKNNRLVKFN